MKVEAVIWLAVGILDDGTAHIVDCDIQRQWLEDSFDCQRFKKLNPGAMIKVVPYQIKDFIYGITYFVDEKNGSDSNDGLSIDTAFKSRQRALDACRAPSGEFIIEL